ncbi:MAG: hypothetical protein HC933_11195 [Pleurocapsa sp. SU_196_0]|nr:hypothetical protein [Pleurocapsa sp. SU_196_0]
MEIVTYVRRGVITHKDHLGNEGRTIAGDVQVVSAGRGIQHSEFNPSASSAVHFLQIVTPSQPLLMVGMIGGAILRSHGDARAAMMAQNPKLVIQVDEARSPRTTTCACSTCSRSTCGTAARARSSG